MARVQCAMTDKMMPGLTAQEAITRITAAVSAQPGVRIERPDNNTLVVVTRFTPGWAIVLGLLFLPIVLGLLIFLVKREDRVTIIGRDVDGGAYFTVAGWTNQPTAAFLKTVFPKTEDTAPEARVATA